MNKERKHMPIGHYLLFSWILFLYFFVGYYALNRQDQPLTEISKAYFKLPENFHSRLRKHGLDKQFSVIEENKGNLYFYRDGKKCTF